jgi:hypothetical protein
MFSRIRHTSLLVLTIGPWRPIRKIEVVDEHLRRVEGSLLFEEFIETRVCLPDANASLVHITPILSFFRMCSSADSVATANVREFEKCDDAQVPLHQPVENIFVVLTSPYVPGSDCRDLSKQFFSKDGFVTNGMKMMNAVITRMNDTIFRDDLDTAVLNDNVLARSHAAARSPATSSDNSGNQATSNVLKKGSNEASIFAAPTRPFHMVFIAPKEELGSFDDLLDISPTEIRKQLNAGCIAADEVMKSHGLASMADACARRFPQPANTAKGQLLAQKDK